MENETFRCIDGHTCGNPVRMVVEGAPDLKGENMAEKRLHFLKEYDWIRKGLLFEPRGHDLMSGSILYPPSNPENDAAILFIETSGCLPMCGHGTIGTVTFMLEKGIVTPKTPGFLRLEVPAGEITATYTMEHGRVKSVKIINVPSFLYKENLQVDIPGLGKLTMDVGYGGNFYAMIDPQKNYPGLDEFGVEKIKKFSPLIKQQLNAAHAFVHPVDKNINGLTHVMWTGKTIHSDSTARNAVHYAENAIDRSPCGTGTSARMAREFAKGNLKLGDPYIHESIIGSRFIGTIEGQTTVGSFNAIIPGIEGWAKMTGENTIIIDEEDDPFAFGFRVS